MVALLLVVGCSGERGVAVPPVPENFVSCEFRLIQAEELSGYGDPGCDLEGSSIVFSRGEYLEIGHIGSRGGTVLPSRQTREIRSTNWGTPGVGVTIVDRGSVEIFGMTPQATALELMALAIDDLESSSK